MAKGISLGKTFGIEIELDLSWFIIFFLIAWSLGGHYFPHAYPDWPYSVYWIVGIITSAVFFLSVLAHEIAHSLVSYSRGVPVRKITLFIFGGAAQLTEEPRNPSGEFLMAIAGPVTSLFIAFLFYVIWKLVPYKETPLAAMAFWIGRINIILAVFNMLPGFPLDGGRVLRSILWKIFGNLRRATRISSFVGRFFAFMFIFWGILTFFSGNWVGGLWIAFIGMFLHSAAESSYKQLVLKEILSGVTAKEVMGNCPTVNLDATVDEFVHSGILRTGRRCFSIVDGDNIRGLVTFHNVKGLTRERWTNTQLRDIMIPIEKVKTVSSDTPLNTVLEKMTVENVNQFPVVDDSKLVGIVARDQVLNFIHVRSELGIS